MTLETQINSQETKTLKDDGMQCSLMENKTPDTQEICLAHILKIKLKQECNICKSDDKNKYCDRYKPFIIYEVKDELNRQNSTRT